MSTVAVGDIHGNVLALDDLLAQIVPAMRPEDTLVFLSDYIDRGPDTRGCVDRIVRLKVEADFAVVTLLGNHEQWMLKSLVDRTSHSWVIGMEAFDTIATIPRTRRASFRAPSSVYDRSKPFGPIIFISQLSFSCDPTTETRQSPVWSVSTCSTRAITSRCASACPVLCISTTTAIREIVRQSASI